MLRETQSEAGGAIIIVAAAPSMRGSHPSVMPAQHRPLPESHKTHKALDTKLQAGAIPAEAVMQVLIGVGMGLLHPGAIRGQTIVTETAEMLRERGTAEVLSQRDTAGAPLGTETVGASSEIEPAALHGLQSHRICNTWDSRGP
ncbi:hypothetical protein WJX84_005039 [Apatococcus fuscideae]|uniref:Uncharacterized protein n=1 Tax=Apatococcus fuscideae TaxID=2026836 RepID=A0AAW1RN49_9CHLO